MCRALVLVFATVIVGCSAKPSVPARSSNGNASQNVAAGQSPTTGSPDAAASGTAQPNSRQLAIRMVPLNGDSARVVFEVSGLSDGELAQLSRLSGDEWPRIYSVRVSTDSAERSRKLPAVLGSYRISDSIVQFEPAFPLDRGLNYRARFDWAMSGRTAAGSPNPLEIPAPAAVEADFVLAKIALDPTIVEQIYPTADTLPENQLKFYVHFSAPMSRGEAYRHAHLLDESDHEVDMPFLELDEELWDPQGKRCTLLIDPGRIKRGLKPREEVGPVFEEGKSYTLVIDRDWHDANGNPLVEPVRKRIRIGPPDNEQPDPNQWKVRTPAAGSTAPLALQFPEPLDHAMLHRVLVVMDSDEHLVRGQIHVSDHERHWELTPDNPWVAGDYTVQVQTDLEDLAGNSIARMFDVDLMEPISRSIKAERWSLSFRIDP